MVAADTLSERWDIAPGSRSSLGSLPLPLYRPHGGTDVLAPLSMAVTAAAGEVNVLQTNLRHHSCSPLELLMTSHKSCSELLSKEYRA